MNKKFSTKWKSSKQPRKQRKYMANAPIHLKKKMLNASLSKELRKKYGKRSMPLRKDDTVRIMRGKFKGKQGKITGIKSKNFRIEVEGIQIKKQDGSKVNIKLQPSNLQIIELNLQDSRRNKALKSPVKEIKEKSKTKNMEIKNAP